MLEAVALVGQTLTNQEDELETLLQKMNAKVKDKKQYVGKLNFRLDEEMLELHFEEVDEHESPKRYLWVGNVKGSGSQYFVTATNPEYLIGDVVANLLKELEPKSEIEPYAELYNDLLKISEKFFREVSGGKLLDLERAGLSLQNEENAAEKEFKELRKATAKTLVAWFKEQLNSKTENVGYWTLLINGVPIASYSGYRDFVLYKKTAAKLEQAQPGYCMVCGKNRDVSIYPFRGLNFKYYILDKIGFSSGLQEKGFYRNYAICADCYKSLLAAEIFIGQKLAMRLGHFNVYVIPAFLSATYINGEELEVWAGKIKNSVNMANSISGLTDMEGEINDYLDDEELDSREALLNFMFYKQSKSEFRVLRLIKDVTPSRLKTLVREMHREGQMGDKWLGPSKYWYLDFNGIYYLIPLKTGQKQEYKKILALYDDLISGWPVDYGFLMKEFGELIKIYALKRFVNVNIKISNSDWDLARAVLKANLFLHFLRRQGLLRGGNFLVDYVNEFHMDDQMKGFLEEMGYDGPRAALFLLGYLTNQVAYEQHKQGHENKPVLGKINYEGMSFSKIIHYTNALFNLLRQYKALYFSNELCFADAKTLLDKHAADWPLSAEENVFYLLSGYGYGVQRAVLAAKKKKEAEVIGNE